jgi:hypothetical protein
MQKVNYKEEIKESVESLVVPVQIGGSRRIFVKQTQGAGLPPEGQFRLG